MFSTKKGISDEGLEDSGYLKTVSAVTGETKLTISRQQSALSAACLNISGSFIGRRSLDQLLRKTYH
jgi:hypothetical protein